MIMIMIFFCRGSDDNLQVKAHQEESSECQILLLGDFHKRGPLEIPVRLSLCNDNQIILYVATVFAFLGNGPWG